MALSPEAQAALIGGGLQVGGSIFSAIANGEISKAELAAQVGRDQADALFAIVQQQGEVQGERESLDQRGFESAQSAIGGPLDIAGDRQQMALRRSLLFDGPGGGPQYVKPATGVMQKYANVGALPRFDSARPFFSDEAMLASEEPFWKTIGGMTGGKIRPTLEGAGYGDAEAEASSGRIGGFADEVAAGREASRNAYDTELSNTRAAMLKALGESGDAAQGMAEEEDKGGGFWSTLGKIGGAALPFVAAPFTGGSSLALAGLGAAGGAISGLSSGGGVKGALLGAGLGAATGGMAGGGAGSASTLGAGEAVKQSLVNPRAIASIAGAGIGGPVGSAAQLASGFLPGAKGVIPMNNAMGSGSIPAANPPGWQLQQGLQPPLPSREIPEALRRALENAPQTPPRRGWR